MLVMTDPRALEYRRRICKAMNFISQNLQQELSLDEISQVAHFSKFHFHRLFNSMVGETVGAFTKRLRLEKAAEVLLVDHTMDITSLSFNYCFSSSQNFARAFKQHFGKTPTQFKKENSNQRHMVSNNGHSLATLALYDVDTVHWSEGGQSMLEQLDVSIQQTSNHHVAYTRRIGAYGFEGCSKAYAKLIPWAARKGLLGKETVMGVVWDNAGVTAAENCRYDACITVPNDFKCDGEMALQTISAGTYAIYHAQIVDNDFGAAWLDFMGSWLPQSGYVPDDKPCYEIELENGINDPQGKWLMALHIPVKPL